MSSMETSENNVYRHICSATDVRNVLLKITIGIYKKKKKSRHSFTSGNCTVYI